MDMTPPAWRKSSYSGSSGDNCIEAASQLGTIAVRDTKDPSSPQLAIQPATWHPWSWQNSGAGYHPADLSKLASAGQPLGRLR